MSYRPQIPVMVRSAARYVDRIIKGEKTGDLPLSNPSSGTHCNLKTAKAPGLEIPPTLLE
jgi:putative tryptophan/tyrosine transport system substrate-binding protein